MPWPKGRPRGPRREKSPPRVQNYEDVLENVLDPDISNDELVEQALVDEIRKKPPRHELVALATAYAKIRMVRTKTDKSEYMAAFESDDSAAAPPPS
jgi:hypothetical protein